MKNCACCFVCSRFNILVVLLLPVLTLAGQEQSNYVNNLPELTELRFDTLEMQTWQPEPDSSLNAFPQMGLRIESRQNWKPSTDYLTNRFIVSPSLPRKGYVPAVHLVYYQKLRKHYYPNNLGQAGLFFQAKGIVSSVILGSFRLQAGNGLCLGAYKTRDETGSGLIYPDFNLSHPALNGAAVQLRKSGLNTILWLSQTERLALMDKDKITRLYESLITDMKDRDKIQERSNGILANYRAENFSLGATYARMDYSKDFSDSNYVPVPEFLGLFGSLSNKLFAFRVETDFLQDSKAMAAELEYGSNKIKQLLSYIYRPDTYPLSYAKTGQVFGQKTGSEEISWDMVYKPVPKLSLTSRLAAFRDLTAKSDTRWKERSILSVNWQEKPWQCGFTWYRFKKDTLAEIDSLQSELLPTQNRLKVFCSKDITSQISFKMTCQYQHYLDQKVTKNGFSMQQKLLYKASGFSLGAEFLAWTNQKSTYQPTDDPTDDELLLQSDSDTAFRFHLTHKLSNKFSTRLTAYRPNRRVKRQSYWLNLQVNV